MTDTGNESLAADLARAIDGEVLFGEGERAMYATDASNYRRVPIGVVRPKHPSDVVEGMRVCRDHDVPVLGRGGGTSLAGQCCNVAVVFDFSRHMNRVIEIDADRRTARVEPGTVLDDLRSAASRYGLTFGPDPATHNRCTIGGMIGNDSCGIHSVLASNRGPGARTGDNLAELDVLTRDGTRMRVGPTTPDQLEQIVRAGGRKGETYRKLLALRSRYETFIRSRFPDIPRRVSGYDLPALLPENGFDVARVLAGTEGTCALTLEATVRLIPEPRDRALVVLGYPDVYAAADDVPAILPHAPIGLEAIDDELVEDMQRTGMHSRDLNLLPDGRGWLLVEFGGDEDGSASEHARAMMEDMRGRSGPPSMKRYDDPGEEQRVWAIRESGLGATAFVPGDPATWPGWEDAAVPPERLGDYLRKFRALLDAFDYQCSLYGHFGQGCVHTRIDFELHDRPGLDRYMEFIERAADLVVEHGGSLSGEHGDGVSRAGLLDRMYGEEGVRAFREFKAIWDPDGRMNPGRIVDPEPADAHLYLGPDYAPEQPLTKLAFHEDDFSFAEATSRCVGVGKCRRHDGGTMCPSYMVTREERHSTRGRARMLNEMLRGEVITDGWRSEEVRDALDLCLACKGCKQDCPVSVDMASYKAEFLSHYYERRLRPRSAYAMGLIHWWARLARRAPRLVNAIASSRVLGPAVRWVGGVSPKRRLPEFATESFREWWNRRPEAEIDGPPVLLWPDTFNDQFHPEVAIAAVEVLEAAGFAVRLPESATLCCGRPLYDYGMLDLAKRKLGQIIEALRPAIRAGVPVVGLEPSCMAVFRDELQRQFPHDEDAARLARQSLLLSEFLEARAGDREPGRLEGRALLHVHCHQHAVLNEDAAKRTLETMGLEVEVPDSGCCGMAGSFGFEVEHYDVSQACAERTLLPAAREADPDTWIVTDGFSCREMLEQNGIDRVMHTAEVARLALTGAGRAPTVPDSRRNGKPHWGAAIATTAGALVIGAAAAAWRAFAHH